VLSRRALGVFALAAIVVAAISFAIVDVAIASQPCSASELGCAGVAPPIVAVTFSALGALGLLVSILPAVNWVVESIQHAAHVPHELETATARSVMPKSISVLDDDD